jgi:hypothetical protein
MKYLDSKKLSDSQFKRYPGISRLTFSLKVHTIIHCKTQQILSLCISKGAVHDFELFKRNLHLVPTNSFIRADKGYQGIYDIYPNSLLSCKTKKFCELGLLLKTYNREINKRRKVIEHVFGTLKSLKTLAERY